MVPALVGWHCTRKSENARTAFKNAKRALSGNIATPAIKRSISTGRSDIRHENRTRFLVIFTVIS
jgi:hypothetical protein